MAAGVSACERQRGSSTAQLFGRGGEGEASEGEPHQAPAESQGHHLHEYTETTCQVPAPTHFSTAMPFSF